MSRQKGSAHRRLILDLFHGASDAETMRIAVEFAKLLGLDLHCLFIEDQALLALAELPFAREIRLPTHQWSPLNADTLARELEEAASQTRRLLDEILRGVEIVSEFEVLRGDPAACLAAVCQTGDIVIVAESGAPAVRTAHGVRRLRAAAHASAASVLLLPARHKARRGHVVAVIADVMDGSLEVACRIAIAANEGVAILLSEPADEGVVARVTERAQTLGLPRERVTLRLVRSTHADDVISALAGLQEHLVVMTRTPSAADAGAGATRISAARGVPVLLIEAESDADQPTERVAEIHR
jgi:hypothetical protein